MVGGVIMSLRDELREVYKTNTYKTPNYQLEFDRLKKALFNSASNGDIEYWVDKDEFPLIMRDVVSTTMWLDENELPYNALTQDNLFGHLIIKWD